MNYNINLGNWSSVFAVPTAVVDKYLLLASGPAVKVLLYLLRNSEKTVSEEQITKELKISSETVNDAITFWTEAGLLSADNNDVLSPAEAPKNVAFIAEVNKTAVNVRKVEKPVSSALSPSEIAQRIEGSTGIKYLFDEAQKLFGRTLNYTEQRGLIGITDYIGLHSDIILMIIRYCKSIDKCTMRNIESIASGWSDEGITTHAQAEAKLAALKKRNKLTSKIKTSFGIDRNLSSKEVMFIEKWSFEYKMSFEMIERAYQIMCDNGIAKTSFAYMDKILSNWNTDGVHTPDAIVITRRQSSKKDDSAPSYNIAEFEKQALNKTPKGAKND